MSWEDTLKAQALQQDVQFDAMDSCCSQLKTDFSAFVEKLFDYYSSEFGYSENTGMKNWATKVIEEPCEFVVKVIESMLNDARNPPKESKLPSWAAPTLEKMLDDYRKCLGE